MPNKLNIGDVNRSEIETVIGKLQGESGTIYPLPFLRLLCDAGHITFFAKRAMQQTLGGKPRRAKDLIKELQRILNGEGDS